MNPLLVTMVGSLVRAGLVAGGAQALLSADQTDQRVGAVLVVGSVAWSLWQKYHAQVLLADARKGF